MNSLLCGINGCHPTTSFEAVLEVLDYAIHLLSGCLLGSTDIMGFHASKICFKDGLLFSQGFHLAFRQEESVLKLHRALTIAGGESALCTDLQFIPLRFKCDAANHMPRNVPLCI